MVLWYILVGVVICLLFDLILTNGKHQLENSERVAIILLWPIMVMWFLYYIIKYNFKNEDN